MLIFKYNQDIRMGGNMDKLKYIDLFAGIGGIRLGFDDENTECVFSSEWDKFAQQTYEANFREKPAGDIKQIKASDIPNHDVLLGGFPCQPFSNIGKRNGFSDENQGTLFFDILRILQYHQPSMFLLENVPGILTIDGGKTFEVIMESLENAGYNVFYDVLDAKNFGLAQNRKRVIFVGFHKGLGIDEFIFPKGNNLPNQYAKDIIEKDADPVRYSISKNLQKNYLVKKDDGRPQIIDENSEFQVKTLVSTYHKIQRLTGTFVRGGETGLRLMSELECKRIMGFPDDYIIPVSRTQMYRQMGNSVAIPVIKEVSNEMKYLYGKVKKLIS